MSFINYMFVFYFVYLFFLFLEKIVQWKFLLINLNSHFSKGHTNYYIVNI